MKLSDSLTAYSNIPTLILEFLKDRTRIRVGKKNTSNYIRLKTTAQKENFSRSRLYRLPNSPLRRTMFSHCPLAHAHINRGKGHNTHTSAKNCSQHIGHISLGSRVSSCMYFRNKRYYLKHLKTSY